MRWNAAPLTFLRYSRRGRAPAEWRKKGVSIIETAASRTDEKLRAETAPLLLVTFEIPDSVTISPLPIGPR